MNILVTGASGFIGARLVRALLDQGDTVHVLGRKSSDFSEFDGSGVQIFRGDLASPADVRAAMQGCDRVYHLAAFAKNWARHPEEVHRINRDALGNMFRVARELAVRRVLYTSTVMVYGPSDGQPVDERTERAFPPSTLYEESKIDGERVVASALDEGLDIVIVHPTRVFGPGHLTEANSTTILIKQYLEGTWRLLPGDGSAEGNYVYVKDVVAGCIAAMERGRRGGHYILGGENLTFNAFFAILAEATGKKRLLLPVPERVAYVAAAALERLGRLGLVEPPLTPGWVRTFFGDWLCSSALAEREIGYAPTPVKQGVSETIAWLRSLRTHKASI
jgi:nucleoside-diphosphate-sugar epimerase